MKNKIKIAGVIAIIIVIGFTMLTCDTRNNNDETYNNDDKTENKGDETLPTTFTPRYETKPINNTINSANSNAVQGLIYSCYDDNYYYYVFVIGHINYVPIAYRDAIFYNGKTPITVGYTKSNATENSITRAITTAIENSITESYKKTVEVTSEITGGVRIKFFNIGSKITAKSSFEYGWTDTETRSVSNTVETTEKKINEYNDSITVTIGSNNEDPGKYRYSLFATTDVYYIVQVDKFNFKIKSTNTEICVRPETFAWGIDYEPDPAGNFGKTAAGDLLDIPKVNYSTLPKPADYIGGTTGQAGNTSNPENDGNNTRLPTHGGQSPIEIDFGK